MGQIADIIKRLRDPGKPPQLDGYRLYKQEQEENGESAVPYEEWIKTAPPTGPAPDDKK